jgi:hypothetical protein
MSARSDRHDLTKLPKWAQTLIAVLESDIRYLKAKVEAGPENSNTFADPHADPPRPLGQSPNIQFMLGRDDLRQYIQARIQQDHNGTPYVYIMGGDSIVIEPQSSNTVRLRIERH